MSGGDQLGQLAGGVVTGRVLPVDGSEGERHVPPVAALLRIVLVHREQFDDAETRARRCGRARRSALGRCPASRRLAWRRSYPARAPRRRSVPGRSDVAGAAPATVWHGRVGHDRRCRHQACMRPRGCAPGETPPPSPSGRGAPSTSRSGRPHRRRRGRRPSRAQPPRPTGRRRACSGDRTRSVLPSSLNSTSVTDRAAGAYTRTGIARHRRGTLPASRAWVACRRERGERPTGVCRRRHGSADGATATSPTRDWRRRSSWRWRCSARCCWRAKRVSARPRWPRCWRRGQAAS